MSIFTFNEVRAAYSEWQSSSLDVLAKSAKQVLKEERQSFEKRTYDVFLSHSSLDSKDVLGLCRVLRKRFGLEVYVDLDDEELDANEVTPETAKVLRERMKYSRSLLYAASVNATASKWMPWELGFFDGLKGTVAILPVGDEARAGYKGQEYLGLYPYVDHATADGTTTPYLWVNGLSTAKGYLTFDRWLSYVAQERA